MGHAPAAVSKSSSRDRPGSQPLKGQPSRIAKMETDLMESLTQKLDGLELRVQAYRKEVVTDFQRFYQDLLCGVNPATSSGIEQKLSAVLANYSTLYPELKAWHDSNCKNTVSAGNAAIEPAAPKSGTAIPRSAAFQPQIHTSGFGAAPGDQREPDPREELRHEREVELQGLFTPTYLPLLDSNNIFSASSNPQSPSQPQQDASAAAGSPQSLQPGLGGPGSSNSHDTMDEMSEPSRSQSHPNIGRSVPAQVPVRSDPGRRASADMSTSAGSDEADPGPPRSALRRASTPGRTPVSPRRVRFEFEGLEVLPTSSPQATDMGTMRPISPDPPSPGEDTSEIIADSILGPDEEGSELPPKKVSSSDKLRALSRAPLDSGTVWTVVNPDSESGTPTKGESSPMVAALNTEASSGPPIKSQVSVPSTHTDPIDMASIGPSLETVREHREEEEREEKRVEEDEQPESEESDSSSDDEGFLAIAKARSFSKKKAIQPHSPVTSTDRIRTSSGAEPVHGTASLEHHSSDDTEPDEDEPFYFETGGLSAPPRPKSKSAMTRDDIPADNAEASPVLSATPEPRLGMSPAVSISKRAEPGDSADTPASTSVSGQMPSVGSYKGRSVVMPVVKDPEVHARAASLNLSTFVGSLGGNSGMDEADASSYRASVGRGSFTGAPRSFTERLLMEEEQEKNRGSISGAGGL